MKRELRLAPSYILLVTWIGFTAIILLWVVAASLSTSAEIFSGCNLSSSCNKCSCYGNNVDSVCI